MSEPRPAAAAVGWHRLKVRCAGSEHGMPCQGIRTRTACATVGATRAHCPDPSLRCSEEIL